MNRVLNPTTIDLRKEEIRDTKLLNRQVLFTADKEDFYIKYHDELIPVGGACKQNYLQAGDNIEILREDEEGNEIKPEIVRLLDDIGINTATLGKFSDTIRWKGTIKIGELKNHNTILLLTKLTDVGADLRGLLGGEILVNLVRDDDSSIYGQYAITVSSTGSWSLKGAISAASEVRMCKCKWGDEYYYGLKFPASIVYALETSTEKYVVDTLYEEEEKYTDTETSKVQTEYEDDFFIGMAVATTTNGNTYHYDDRNFIALCNNETGTAVVLNDTVTVPQNADSRVHWQYCAIKDLMNLRGEELKDDDGTALYEYYTNNYYLYFKTFFQNDGGNSRDANVKVALTDCYVCNTSGNFDPELTPANVVEHVEGDRPWLNIDESIKKLSITKNSNPKTFEIYIYRSAMNTFYIRAGSNYIQLNYSGLYSGYNGWYWVSLDNIFNNLGFTAQGALKNYVGKGYYLYLYMYRRTSGTNYSFRVTQVAITTQQMNAAPLNGTTGVIANYGVVDQDWVDFNGDLVRNDTYYNLTLQQHVPLMTFVDLIETIKATELNNSNNFVHSFGNFKFITTAVKEHEVEKTRIVPKISQEVKTRDVNYSSYWEDVNLTRTGETTFSLNKNGISIDLTQAFQSSGYNYWYYVQLDDVFNLAGYHTGLEDDNLAPYYGKGYCLYLRIYRKNGTDYNVRITAVAVTKTAQNVEPEGNANTVLFLSTDDQDWIDLNAVIVTARTGYYYNMPHGTSIIAFSITQKGKIYRITEQKCKEVKVWFNGWYDIPDELVPKGYTDPEITYQVLSDKSNDNDSFADTYYLTAPEVSPKIQVIQDTGEDNAPYKFIVSGPVSMTYLKEIAAKCQDPEKQIYLDMSQAYVDSTAEVWDTHVFRGCVSLRGFIIPQGVKQIAECAFIWCTYMRQLDFSPSAGTLVSVGADSGWSTSVGLLTSTRVRTLYIPASVNRIGKYLVGTSNLKNLIFLHQDNNPLSVEQWSFTINDTSGQQNNSLPDDFHTYVTESWWNSYLKSTWWQNSNWQWGNSGGWWTPEMVASIVTYNPDWDEEHWQDFHDKYGWSESLINDVRSKFGYDDTVEIKE